MVNLPRVWTKPFSREIIETLKLEAAKRFRHLQLPEKAESWQPKRRELVEKITEKIAIDYPENLPLDWRETSCVSCDGYSIRQLYYQSRKDFYVTASLYVPDGDGPFPGVVNMHGHWSQGRLAAKIQAVGHLLAKAGYVVIAVDAFGSGERSTEHGVFEYHGGLLGGMLMNVGDTLMGIQIVDNMRAVDLLHALPFVDSDNIGATGGSGGGNQTMYLAAFDQRIKAAVPVVSVGSYESYVGGTNCVCELLPDGLEICEESAILGLIAPRALKICNAMHDINPTFYVSEMLRSYTEAKKIYAALGVPEKISTLAFDAEHSYPKEVQETMLGFFDFYLRGKGHGLPAEVPTYSILPEEQLMVFEKGKRPDKVVSIQKYIARKAERLQQNGGSVAGLKTLLRINSESIKQANFLSSENGWEKHSVETTSGRMLPFLFLKRDSNCCRVLAAPGGKEELIEHQLLQEAQNSGDSILIFDPWGCGESGYIEEQFPVFAEQHNLSRSLIWLGRRLMGEWCSDFMLASDFVNQMLPDTGLHLIGRRDSGIAALFAAVIQPEKIRTVTLFDSPKSLMYSGKPGEKFMTMACCIPNIINWGDVKQACNLAQCEVNFVRPRLMDGSLIAADN